MLAEVGTPPMETDLLLLWGGHQEAEVKTD
jgi:hypothetical protein